MLNADYISESLSPNNFIIENISFKDNVALCNRDSIGRTYLQRRLSKESRNA
jgi:hypothetical protein